MPASERKRRIAHPEYATDQRLKRLEQEIDTFLEDFFEDHLDDPHFVNVEGEKQEPFEVEIDTKLKGEADYTGDELTHVAAEHKFRHGKIQGMAKKYFGHDVGEQFDSDREDGDHMTFLHVTISELPSVAKNSEHAFPKKMRDEVSKELRHFVADEIGDDILGLTVRSYTGKGTKDIGEYFFTKEKMKSEYDHVHLIIAFKWKHKPIFKQQSSSHNSSEEDKLAARRSTLYMHRSEQETSEALDHIADAIGALAESGTLSVSDVLSHVWDELD